MRRALDRLYGASMVAAALLLCAIAVVVLMQVALNIGMDARFVLETPLMWIDKAATWALAQEIGGAALVNVIVEATHTCYLGERGALHDWGHGCGQCPACKLRAAGFARWRAPENSN